MSCTAIWRVNQLNPAFSACLVKNEKWIDSFLSCKPRVERSESELARVKTMALWTNETIEMMFLRVSLGLFGDDLDAVEDIYDRLNRREFNLSSSAYKNIGSLNNQAASCFVSTMEDDFKHQEDVLHEMALVLNYGSAEGVGLSRIREAGSPIGTRGITSLGPNDMVKRISELVQHIYTRPGKVADVAVYLDMWHSDIEEFLQKPITVKNISFAVMIPNLFYECLAKGDRWYLFSPHKLPGIDSVYGDEFVALYRRGVEQKLFSKEVDVSLLNNLLVSMMASTGRIFTIFKDNVNRSNNQQGLGSISNLNLCAEICQVTNESTRAVCTLGTMCFPTFVEEQQFNFERFENSARVLAKVVDRLVDAQTYHAESTRRGAEWRAIGLGGSGLANVFFKLRIPYESDAARKLNAEIYETLQFAALTQSCDLARKHGPHKDYRKTMLANGIFGFETYSPLDNAIPRRCDWEFLRGCIAAYGVRNSLVTTQMPTAGSSIIMGVTPSFEAQYGNIVTHHNMAGMHQWINPLVVEALGSRLDEFIPIICADNGSISSIDELKSLHEVCKTVFEMDPQRLILMEADRQRYICQSQSFNLFLRPLENLGTTIAKLMFMSNRLGNKTGSYYTHIQHASKPMSFGAECSGGACTL